MIIPLKPQRSDTKISTNTTEIKKNIMTIESIAKYDLKHVNQCELNENIGFNMDKALRFVEFQCPDVIYLEGIKTREAFEFLSELYYNFLFALLSAYYFSYSYKVKIFYQKQKNVI